MEPTGGYEHVPIRIGLLGGLRIVDDRTVHHFSPTTIKGIVLALLASRCNERVHVDVLAESMWPDGPPRTHRTAIRVLMSRLRDVLGDGDGELDPTIIGHTDAYELRCNPDVVDLGHFERLVRLGQTSLADGEPTRAAAAFRRALATWGEPFGGADSVHLSAVAERLRLAQGLATLGVMEAEVALGRENLLEVEAAVAADPLDERRWGYLMIALYRRGRQAEALATFQRARDTLADEVGLEPGQYLRRVEQRILLQDESLLHAARHDRWAAPDPAASDPVTIGRGRTPRGHEWPHPPVPTGPLLMRDLEQREVSSLLERWRAVTIVGAPGVGKTSLAAAVARNQLEHPVAWVSLGAVHTGPGTASDIAVRLGLVSEAQSDPIHHTRLIGDRIADRPLLLVLDNIEHLVDPVRDLVASLLRDCPNLSVLMTSRRPLNAAGEQTYRLQPFTEEPGTGQPSTGVRFLAARRGRPLDESDDLAALDRIVSHLGGLALGLEQAALRLNTLSAVELAEHLTSSGPAADDPMARTIGWSLRLLEPQALELLMALAHLDGPWPIDRARAIGTHLGLDRTVVERVVNDLIDQSLVVATADGRRRIIEPVRQLVMAHPVVGDDPVRYGLARAQAVTDDVVEGARLVDGVDQKRGIHDLNDLMPDIRGTVRWAVDNDRPEIAARMLAALRSWWSASGLYADGQTLHAIADPVITAWAPATLPERELRLFALAARVRTRPGFASAWLVVDELEAWLGEAVASKMSAGVRSLLAHHLASALIFSNRDLDRADALAHGSLRDAEEAGDPWMVAWARYSLAICLGRTDPLASLTLFEEAVAAFADVGDFLGAARISMFLGHGTRIFGDVRSSETAFERAETWCRELGAAPVTQLDCELGRAQGADTGGRDDEAAERYRSIIPRLAALGDHRCAAVAERGLAAILARRGELDAASALAARALHVLRTLGGEETEVAVAHLVLAEIAEARGHHAQAAEQLALAQQGAFGAGVPLELRDHARIAALAERLGMHQATHETSTSGVTDR